MINFHLTILQQCKHAASNIPSSRYLTVVSPYHVRSAALRVTGVSEPVIYHGYTFTTKLPFRDVIETIRVGSSIIVLAICR